MPGEWYEVVTAHKTLMQGDFVPNCPTLTLPGSLAELQAGELDVDIAYYNAVIIPQSCDLYSKGAGTILLCPRYPFKEWIQRSDGYQNLVATGKSTKGFVKEEFKNLKAGRRVAYHLLNRDEEAGIPDYQVVELNAAFAVRRDIIEQLLQHQTTTVRLNSPYREHLSQAYATVFMRVGLPTNIGDIADPDFYEPDEAFKAQVKAKKP